MISFLKINDLGDENEDKKRHAACKGEEGKCTHIYGVNFKERNDYEEQCWH